MNSRILSIIIVLVGTTNLALADAQTTYAPLGSWVASRAEAPVGSIRAPLEGPNFGIPAKARPQLPGVRPKEVELLQDRLTRAFSNKHNKPEQARHKLREMYSGSKQRGSLRGYMAEAMFLDRNPQWGYVDKPTAPQHDVYRRVPGRRAPLTGQIKYHGSLDPARYAADMRMDYRAHKFFIPDDHVEATKRYLRDQARRLEASGDEIGAKREWRNHGRLDGIEATSGEIGAATSDAARGVAREVYATYTALGAASALSVGPVLVDWAKGDMTANVAADHATKALALTAVAAGADRSLIGVRQGALRGTVRGNIIVGTVVTIAQTTWLLRDYGWQRAFYRPEFYDQVAGGVSAVSMGLAGGTVAAGLAAGTGPWAPVVGVGAGAITGTIGYFGGKTASHALLELLAPEMLREQERQRITAVKAAVNG